MKQINDDNIDEIMFQLLEGEITGKEREQLIHAIEADVAYNKLWRTWQQTILHPGEEVLMNTKGLKKRTARIIPFNYKYAIAAMLVLGFGLALFFYNSGDEPSKMVDVPKSRHTTQPVIKIPKPQVKTPIESREDSISSIKEKIRSTAYKLPEIESRNSEQLQEIDLPLTPNTKMPEAEKLVEVPDNKKTIPQQLPANKIEADDDHVIVTMSSSSKPAESSKSNFLTRIFGKPRLKFENDSSTRTNKRLIIENKQYKIIAGF